MEFQEEFYRNGKGIVDDLWTTSYDEMRKILIPIPPPNFQNIIIEKLNLIDEIKNEYSSLVEDFQNYKNSICSNFVFGNIEINE